MTHTAKKTTSIPLQKTRRVIQLDQSQYQLYLKGQLDIYSPDALLLESIGEPLNKTEAEVDQYRLRDQLSLVEALVVTSSGQLELSERALAGLADMLYRANQALTD